jgi:exodeoxyribonuclease V alpha subunit
MLADLQGQIERITYTNEENGYTIAKVKVYGRRDLVTVVGNFMAPMPGEVFHTQLSSIDTFTPIAKSHLCQ